MVQETEEHIIQLIQADQKARLTEEVLKQEVEQSIERQHLDPLLLVETHQKDPVKELLSIEVTTSDHNRVALFHRRGPNRGIQ